MHKLKHQSQRFSWLFLVPRLLICLLAPATYGLNQYLAGHPDIVENWYSTGLYPYLAQSLSLLTGWLPVSLAEWLILFGIITIVVFVSVQTYRLFTRPDPWMRLVKFVSALLAAASLAYCAFYFLWGWNYYRKPIEESLGFQRVDMSSELLQEVCETLIVEARQIRETLPEDASGCVTLQGQLIDRLTRVNANYNALAQNYPGLWGTHYGPPKTVLFSIGMSYADISGIYIPYTAEANLNVDMPDFLQLSTASHEAAHQRGIAREDEANFMAFLSCRASEDPAFIYSGTMLALIYCMNELHDDDYEAFSSCYELYSEAQKRDLAQHNAYWKAFEGPVQEASNTVNDSYLKSNHQSDGIKSYARMVSLVLKWYGNTQIQPS